MNYRNGNLQKIGLQQLLLAYVERFNESFPVFMLRNMEETEMIVLIKNCLDHGKPYVVDFDNEPGIDY